DRGSRRHPAPRRETAGTQSRHFAAAADRALLGSGREAPSDGGLSYLAATTGGSCSSGSEPVAFSIGSDPFPRILGDSPSATGLAGAVLTAASLATALGATATAG